MRPSKRYLCSFATLRSVCHFAAPTQLKTRTQRPERVPLSVAPGVEPCSVAILYRRKKSVICFTRVLWWSSFAILRYVVEVQPLYTIKVIDCELASSTTALDVEEGGQVT